MYTQRTDSSNKIQLSNPDRAEGFFNANELKNMFGYTDKEIETINNALKENGEYKSKVIMVIDPNYIGSTHEYDISWTAIYGGDDYEEGVQTDSGNENGGTDSDNPPLPEEEQEQAQFDREEQDRISRLADKLKSILDFVSEAIEAIEDFGEDFAHNAVGTIMSKLIDLLVALGDVIQMIANAANWEGLYRITFPYEAILADENLNKIANVGEFSGGGTGAGGQKSILVDNKDEEDEEEGTGTTTTEISSGTTTTGTGTSGKDDKYKGRRFSKETEIPVIPVSLYEVAKGGIGLLDINFLTGGKNHKKDSPWMILRDFVTLLIHITMYISAAFLITALIFYGVGLVRNSITPQERKGDMEGIKKFAIGVVMLVGVVVIMAIGIFFSNMFFEDTKMENKDEGQIRVNVIDGYSGEGIYSFSTNMTGYARYMAQIKNIDLWKEKGYFAIMYFLLALMNLALVGIMLIRVIFLMLLGVLGPIIVIKYVLNQEEQSISNYKDWAMVYISIAFIQNIFAIIYRIIIENAIP